MKLLFRLSVFLLSCVAVNAATVAPKAQAPKNAVKRFEDVTLGKQPIKVLGELINTDKPLIVKFYMPGCPYCTATDEGFEQVAKKYQDNAEFVIVDTTRFDLGRSYGIRHVPTFVIFHKNKKVALFKRGGLKKEGFVEAIEQTLKKLGVTAAQAQEKA